MSKSRKGGILRSNPPKTPVKDGRESQRERIWDKGSDNMDSDSLMQPRKLENTYKLSPDPERRFQPSKARAIMDAVLQEYLSDEVYEKTLGQRMSKMLSDTIKTRIKEFKWNRYKIVVQLIIGENREQDIRAGSRFLWNIETDNYASTTFKNRSLFALAVCFGVYMD